MVISEAKRFVFVHIPKTAGISMQRVLHCEVRDVRSRADDVRISENLEDYHHPFARDVQNHLSPNCWSDYYTFSFVRNPWARMVSWYNMARFVPVDTPSLKRIRVVSFAEFIDLDPPAAHTHFNQLDYITDLDGQIMVDFVGRYENLRDDFQKVCDRLGLRSNLLRRLNRTPPADYRAYYDDRTRAVIAERFARDIEVFGYTF